MVNPIVPRLLGVSDEPASLKIPGHTTYCTSTVRCNDNSQPMIMMGVILSAGEVAKSVPFWLESDHFFGCYSANSDFFARNPPLYVLRCLSPPPTDNHLPSCCFATVSRGLMPRAQRVRVFLAFPGAAAVIYVFVSDYATHWWVLRYLCLAPYSGLRGIASPSAGWGGGEDKTSI